MIKFNRHRSKLLSYSLGAILLFVCILSLPASTAHADAQAQEQNLTQKITVGGVSPQWSSPPFKSKGATYVPLKQTAELLGASVTWNKSAKATQLNYMGDTILHTANTSSFKINGQTITSPTPSITKQGIVFVPIKTLGEVLKANVSQHNILIDITPDPVSLLSAQASEADKYLREKKYSGMALIAIHGEVILRKGYGFGDVNKLNRPDNKTRIASITKSFTAAAIMKLVQEDKLNLDDKLESYIPGFPEGHKITIHMLLSHTAGISSNFTRTKGTTLTTTVNELKRKPLAYQPGTNFSYSNGGYVLLAYIIQQVSGSSYETYLKNNFLIPLGMHDTGEAALGMKLTQGYINSQNSWKPASYYVSQSGTGSLYSTVDDLLKWDTALNNEQLLAQESLDRMFSSYSSKNYGYGWMVKQDNNRKIAFHNGSGTGYSTGISRELGGGTTIILLGNHASMNMINMLDGVRKRVQ